MSKGKGILAIFITGGVVWAQAAATLKGKVLDPSGAELGQAEVYLRNSLTGYERRTETNQSGAYHIGNIPFQDYQLIVTRSGFAEKRQTVSLRSNVPVEKTVALSLGNRNEEVSVTAFDAAELVDVEATGTRTQLNLAQMEHMPVAVGSRALESVLLSFPGFAADANGAIHPRGAHNQMTYAIDGMLVSDQLTGAFGNGIDSSIVQTLELYTGDIPAEYGSKVSAVVKITTRSGLNSGRRFFGSFDAGAAQFDQLANTTQFGGKSGRLGYFASATEQKSNRFLDQVGLDNLHNGGNAARGFSRIDYQLGAADFLRFSAMGGQSSFQLANLRSQQASGQDQRQLLRDAAVSLGYVHVLGSSATIDSTASFRASHAQLFGSPGDTPVTAGQSRHLSNLTWANRFSWLRGRQEWRFGADVQHFPVSEDFTFAITNPPGGRSLQFSDKQAGNQYSGFMQDKLRLGQLLLNIGLRYDRYSFLVDGAQLQPRLGAAYNILSTGTVLRASYNRIYQTPVNENLLLSNSRRASALGGLLIRIQPERQNVYELGVQQSIARRISLNAMYFRKEIANLHDNDNFFNTGIIFPTALAKAKVSGVEGRMTLLETKRLSGSLSFTHYSVLATPPFTGGLFIGSSALALLNSGPFIIDHDQNLGMQGMATYRPRKSVWTSVSTRYDSGLVSNPSDPQEVAKDPDYKDLLRLVNLRSDPPRVRPRTLVDFAVGYERLREGRKRWETVFQLSNAMNQTALYNFQSIFVGTRLVQPRTAGARVRFYW